MQKEKLSWCLPRTAGLFVSQLIVELLTCQRKKMFTVPEKKWEKKIEDFGYHLKHYRTHHIKKLQDARSQLPCNTFVREVPYGKSSGISGKLPAVIIQWSAWGKRRFTPCVSS